jgi:hypothetical protein
MHARGRLYTQAKAVVAASIAETVARLLLAASLAGR